MRLAISFLSMAMILLTACEHYCPAIPDMSRDAKAELRTLVREDGKRFRPEYENLEEYLGQIEKIKRQRNN